MHACIDAYKRQFGRTSRGRGQDLVEHTDEMKTIKKKEGSRAKNNHGNTYELSQKKESSLMTLRSRKKEKTN